MSHTYEYPRAALTVSTASLIHQLSVNAELAAPGGGKHRAVTHPSNAVLPIANYIDTWIAAKQVRDHVLPTTLAGDEEFLRRVNLDLKGAVPAVNAGFYIIVLGRYRKLMLGKQRADDFAHGDPPLGRDDRLGERHRIAGLAGEHRDVRMDFGLVVTPRE